MERAKNGNTDEVSGRGKGGADDEEARAISALNNVAEVYKRPWEGCSRKTRATYGDIREPRLHVLMAGGREKRTIAK